MDNHGKEKFGFRNAKEGDGGREEKHQTPEQLQNSVPKEPQVLLELSSATMFIPRQ